MLTIGQAIGLGLLQGVTELFPISSLGHMVVLPKLFGWHLNQSNPDFLSFIILTHVATATALLLFFWRDWYRIIVGVLRSIWRWQLPADDIYARLGWLIVVATIPAGLLGLIFEKRFAALFAAPLFAALFLIGNGLLLFLAEWLRKRRADTQVSYAQLGQMSWRAAIGVGVMQSLALFPGFSRTGATLSGGLLAGLSHENAARFAFLLSTPIIFAAGVLKLPQLALSGASVPLEAFVLGALAAGIAAYFSTRFLVRYFQTNTLRPFAIYCMCFGILALVVIAG